MAARARLDRNREAAFLALRQVESGGAYSTIEIGKRIRETGADDPAFCRELFYGTLKRKITLDYALRQLVQRGYDRLPAGVRTCLRMGLYQIRAMGSVPDYAAVDETVRIAARYCSRQRALVNAVLRNALRREGDLKKPCDIPDKAERLSVLYSAEPSVVRLLVDDYGEARAESILAGWNETPALCLTVNTLRTDRVALIEELRGDGFRARPSEEAAHSVIAEGSGILSSNAFREGRFFVQGQPSASAVEALAPAPGEDILDVCAAPGGKSLLAAILTEDRARITARDIYPHRLKLLEDAAARLGIRSIRTEVRDAALEDGSGARYDRILCDVPCSGLGEAAGKPEIKYKKMQIQEEELPDLQYTILKNSAAMLRPGGKLLYSTCTILRRENEDVAARFLREEPAFSLEKSHLYLPGERGAEGFFYAVLKRA